MKAKREIQKIKDKILKISSKNHHKAMDIFDLSQNEKDEKIKEEMIQDAIRFEEYAADCLLDEMQPSKAILYRSAASMALQIKWKSKVQDLCLKGFLSEPPREIFKEIKDIYLVSREIE